MNRLLRRSLLSLPAAAFLVAIGHPVTQAKSVSQNPSSIGSDHAAIINAVNGIAIFADLRDWNQCRASFVDGNVEFDYTALTGGQPTVITADKQMEQWAAFFRATFKSTQHLLGSHVVRLNGDRATCISNFQAHHTYLDPQKGTWILSGVYDHDLIRVGTDWKVYKMKLAIAWESGTRP